MADPRPADHGPEPQDGAESQPAAEPAVPTIDRFLGEPTRDLDDWAWLWTGDHKFPVRSHRGLIGRLVVFGKRLLRPLVKTPLQDLWDRQRVFNLILLEVLSSHRDLYRHLEQDFSATLRTHARHLQEFDARIADGMGDVMRHNDALYARVDQKLDLYRREARELWHRLGAFIAAAEAESPRPLAEVGREQTYVELERRWRGSEEEIGERIAVYLPYLEERGEVIDLGCGRGEALKLFAAHGIPARGVDSNSEMVARCREEGLEAERADLIAYLDGVPEGSLGGVVCFHVIEHLPPERLERLIRLAWRALSAGGVLILETPSPLSLVMAARNFWIDPTHQRPVHPASLELMYREAGFEPVHRIDLHPFPAAERLPEIDLARLPEKQKELADSINRLRDVLDDLLFGSRDYGMVGLKP